MENLLRHVAQGRELDADAAELVADSPLSGLAKALLAHSEDPAVLRGWASATKLDQADISAAIAAVSGESDEIDASIDAGLDGDDPTGIIDALARAGVAWTHPTLVEALDHDALRAPASLLLAIADPDAVADWLDTCDVFEDALQVLRSVAMAGATELEDAFSDWREQLADFDEANDEVAQLDGLAAVLDADEHARAVLAGDADIGWLSDSARVADFLQVYGPGEWLPVLAYLDVCDDKAFEFGAFLAVCAVQGIGFDVPEESDAEDLMELLTFEPTADPESWEPLATRLGLGFAVALAADDELALLGAQVGAHERLITYGFHSPGVPGLPMSGTDVERLDYEASTGMMRQLLDGPSMPDAAKVAVIRTLHDLANHVVFGDGEVDQHAQKWVSRFEDSDVDAIALAARRLHCALSDAAVEAERERMDDRASLRSAMVLAAAGDASAEILDMLAGVARGEKVLGLAATQRLALLGTLESLDALAELWARGALYRAPIYREALLTGAEVHVEALDAVE